MIETSLEKDPRYNGEAMLTNVTRIKSEGKMVMEFAPQVQPAHPPQQPHVPQPGFEHLDPPPPPPPAQQPVVVAAEVLQAVNQMLRAHREETMELVEQSSNEFARRKEAELRAMCDCLTRAEEQATANEAVCDRLWTHRWRRNEMDG